MTPHQAIKDALLLSVPTEEPVVHYVDDVIAELHSAGYEVVSHHMLDACRQLAALPNHDTLQARAEALQRIRSCVAVHDDHDPLEVFTEGGA